MALACKICILTRGLSGSKISSLPQTEEELFEHLEKEHSIIVKREGETDRQAQDRFIAKYKKEPKDKI